MSARFYESIGRHARIGVPVDGGGGLAVMLMSVLVGLALVVLALLLILLGVVTALWALGRIAVRLLGHDRRAEGRWRSWQRARLARWERTEVACEAAHRVRCERETGMRCPHVLF